MCVSCVLDKIFCTIKTNMKVTTKNMTDIALRSAGVPRLIALWMYTDSVVSPAPLTKNVITKSSMDKVNAKSAPARIDGAIDGNVTWKKV